MSVIKDISMVESNITKASSGDNDILIAELYDQARGNKRLLMVYKNIEFAVRIGDWIQLNRLYGEFKEIRNCLN